MKLVGQESQILITQVSCVNIPKLLHAIEVNIDYQIYLLKLGEKYKNKSSKIEKKIKTLENYIQANENGLSARQIKEIKEEITYQKLQVKEILLGEDKEEDSNQMILKSLYRLIKDIAEKEGYAIVIEKSSAVIYNKSEIDITDDILTILKNEKKDGN